MVDFASIIREQQQKPSSFTAAINAHRRAGTVAETVKFHSTTMKRGFAPATAASTVVEDDNTENFFERTAKSVEALKSGKVSFKDVAREMPSSAKNVGVGIAETVAPALTNFFKTTGSIIGEGLAYAVDERVREQYQAGNLDILPTITNTTQAKLAKYTFAAGLETAIFRSFPNVMKMQLKARGGVGALQGLGFAITEGLANDKSPEEIMKSIPVYGLSGGALAAVAPYLIPLLKGEVANMPKEVRQLFKNIQDEIKPPAPEVPRQLGVVSTTPSPTAVPLSTPNSRYQAYLRSQGYEPYIPDNQLPAIDAGDTFKFQDKDAITEVVPEKPASPTRDLAPEATPPQPTARPPKSGTTEFPTIKSGEGESRTTTVPRRQVPVGDGTTATSRLEERMRKTLNDVNESTLSDPVTYQRMNKRDQMARAAKYVDENTDDALAVLRGDKDTPEGLLDNSIALALAKKAELTGDANLVVRLASLRSTRAGQEISILTEAEPLGVVTKMEEIIKARKIRAGRKTSSRPVFEETAYKAAEREKKTLVKAAAKEVDKAQLKIAEANQLLNDILC